MKSQIVEGEGWDEWIWGKGIRREAENGIPNGVRENDINKFMPVFAHIHKNLHICMFCENV